MRRRAVLAAAAALLTAAACSSDPPAGRVTYGPSSQGSSPQHSSPPSTPSARPRTSIATSTTISTAPAPGPVRSRAQRVLAVMSEAERVGQLLMVDCSSTQIGAATNAAIGNYHVGSVILDGTSFLSVAQTSTIATLLQQRAAPNVGLFIATDQEGGQVQRLQGPGFSAIPSAVSQGAEPAEALRQDAQQWGEQLHAAGVNVNLAPVLDTVPPDSGPNPPIGDLDREYGHDPGTVSSHGNAVAQGMRAAGIDATVKHFPGLGRVRGNTDLTSGVLDSTTTRHDPYLAPFATAIGDAVPFVMMSTAIYTRIDPNQPAAFSSTIVTGMLRGDLKFRGVIISDDLGISKQVGGYSIGERAVAFIAAGGDIVLTVDATQAPEMTAALLARAKRDPTFKAQVDRAALVVLQAKQARGLLP